MSTYYVDAAMKDDSGDGMSPDRAWKSLSKVNETVFQPGDRILFKAGGYWAGCLRPQGSGGDGQPIMIDQYGSGNKPIIDGLGAEGGVIQLHNQQYWEISNLEITNDAFTPGDRRGVEVTAANFGLVKHIYLKHLTIHHIKGLIGHDLASKRTAGIYIATKDDREVPTRFDDIVIEGNTIHDVENQGIATHHELTVGDYPGTEAWEKRKFTNVVIRNNTIFNISKNAMIIRLTDGGVVEYNVAYNTATQITGNTYFSRSARNTVFQYNEGFLNRSPGRDGSMYDADLQSPGTVWQYSYSHDNAHGLIWFCTVEKDEGIVVRYNISQNDRGILVCVNYKLGEAKIYNNVFYIDESLSPVIIEETAKNTHHYSFFNNIIYNKSRTASYALNSPTTTRVIDYNLYYGEHPATEPDDQHKCTEDPMFVQPGSGAKGIHSVDGYKLRAGSPAIASGKLIEDNGGQDYWGHPVSHADVPNRGAYNGPGVS